MDVGQDSDGGYCARVIGLGSIVLLTCLFNCAGNSSMVDSAGEEVLSDIRVGLEVRSDHDILPGEQDALDSLRVDGGSNGVECHPNCADRVCGSNGCGGICGTCPCPNCGSYQVWCYEGVCIGEYGCCDFFACVHEHPEMRDDALLYCANLMDIGDQILLKQLLECWDEAGHPECWRAKGRDSSEEAAKCPDIDADPCGDKYGECCPGEVWQQ